MRIDIVLHRPADGRRAGAAVLAGPRTAGRSGTSPSDWNWSVTASTQTTLRTAAAAARRAPPSNVIEKNERNKGRRDTLSAAAADSKACEKRGRGMGDWWREVWRWWWWHRLTVYRISATPSFNLDDRPSLMDSSFRTDPPVYVCFFPVNFNKT